MKFWIGGASQTANMSVVMANLIVKEKNYGPHAFIVQLRNSSNHKILPGIMIGDCGDKYGYQAMDNGWIIFRNAQIPRENLLNKITDVKKDGTVVSQFDSKSKRFGVQLAALSGGRIYLAAVVQMAFYGCLAIGVRYAAVRRQFGPPKSPEISILQYPDVQNRLIPLVAKQVIYQQSSRVLVDMWHANQNFILDPKHKASNEMHALSSVIKPLTTWFMLSASHEVRQICGGLGISVYSAVPRFMFELEVNVTWEGDNNVLLQQTARFLLKGLAKIAEGKDPAFDSLKFIKIEPIPEELCYKAIDELKDPRKLLEIMKMRTNLILQKTGPKFQEFIGDFGVYDAWNRLVPFDLKLLSTSFGQQWAFEEFIKFVEKCDHQENAKFLHKLSLIFGYTIFKESAATMNGLFDSETWSKLDEMLQDLYHSVLPDLVPFFDGLSTPDWLLKSAIGHSDGNAYDRLIQAAFTEGKNFGRVDYWRDLLKWREGKSLNLSKQDRD